MVVCRTLDEIYAAAAADAAGDPPLTQAEADRVAAILAPYRLRLGPVDDGECQTSVLACPRGRAAALRIVLPVPCRPR
jgi:hypothetical protein